MHFFRKIVGERLYLSPFDADDTEICSKWTEWMNDRAVADYYGGYHNLVSMTSAKRTLEELKGYRFVIVLLDSDTLIGHISLHDIDHFNRNAFLGIFIGEENFRSKGYGAEAIRLLLGYGFQTLNLHNIMLSVHSDNPAGIQCYKKAGFREVGLRREWVFKDGMYLDTIYMDILEHELEG